MACQEQGLQTSPTTTTLPASSLRTALVRATTCGLVTSMMAFGT